MPEPIDAVPEKGSPTEADVALARAALSEITPADTVGAFSGSIVETDGVLTLYFDTTLRGYVGWKWTVSLSHGAGSSVSVLETELTPAEGSLVAPDWVPWSERLAEYKETQAELAAVAAEHAHDDHGDDDDHDDDDDDDDHDDDALLHSDDFDGVDIDSLDESESESESENENENENERIAPIPDDSALPQVRVDESKNTEDEADDAHPEPPVKPRRRQRAKKDEHSDKGE